MFRGLGPSLLIFRGSNLLFCDSYVMSKVLYFDCFSGASGDMILGALIDAGLPIAELREALGL